VSPTDLGVGRGRPRPTANITSFLRSLERTTAVAAAMSHVAPPPPLLHLHHQSTTTAAATTSSAASSLASSPLHPSAALSAATTRERSGTLSPEDAHQLFDELQRQATVVHDRSLNGFLATLARAPPSAACSDALLPHVPRQPPPLATGDVAIADTLHLHHPYGLLQAAAARDGWT